MKFVFFAIIFNSAALLAQSKPSLIFIPKQKTQTPEVQISTSSNGVVYRRIGDTSRGSDGTVIQHSGDTGTRSDGVTFSRNGQNWIGSDGTVINVYQPTQSKPKSIVYVNPNTNRGQSSVAHSYSWTLQNYELRPVSEPCFCGQVADSCVMFIRNNGEPDVVESTKSSFCDQNLCEEVLKWSLKRICKSGWYPARLNIDPETRKLDADEDGIINVFDICPNSPKGKPVWRNGKWTGCAEGETVSDQSW